MDEARHTISSRRSPVGSPIRTSLLLLIFLTLLLIVFQHSTVNVELAQSRRVNHSESPRPSLSVGDIFKEPLLNVSSIFLLALVNTAPHDLEHRELRRVIRQTWASACQPNTTVYASASRGLVGSMRTTVSCQLVFVVGRMKNKTLEQLMLEESAQFGDVLITDVPDGYSNIALKVLAAFNWASKLGPRYVMKADDDAYLHFTRLVEMLAFDFHLPKDLYGGRVWHGVRPIRDKNHRHYVSAADYKAEQFPPYCSGTQYIVSGHLLSGMMGKVATVSYFGVEDLYIGLLANQLSISPTDFGGTLHINDDMNVNHLKDCEMSTFIGVGHYLGVKEFIFLHRRLALYDSSKNYC